MNNQYTCPKCGNTRYEVDEMRATGGMLSQVFDVQNRHYTAVTCTNCQYTEFYKAQAGMLGSIFDLFTR